MIVIHTMEKPTKPSTGYFIFQSKLRDEFAEEFKAMNFNDRNKFMSEKWNALSNEER